MGGEKREKRGGESQREDICKMLALLQLLNTAHHHMTLSHSDAFTVDLSIYKSDLVYFIH